MGAPYEWKCEPTCLLRVTYTLLSDTFFMFCSNEDAKSLNEWTQWDIS